jgi:hypothetical protein
LELVASLEYIIFICIIILVCEAIGTAAIPGLLCQPRVIVKMIVELQMECRLAGETEVLGENLPQRHFHYSVNFHDSRTSIMIHESKSLNKSQNFLGVLSSGHEIISNEHLCHILQLCHCSEVWLYFIFIHLSPYVGGPLHKLTTKLSA